MKKVKCPQCNIRKTADEWANSNGHCDDCEANLPGKFVAVPHVGVTPGPTFGPWQLREGTRVGIPFIDTDYHIGTEDMDGSEGECLWFDVGESEWFGEHVHGEANARLVVAAPLLYATLMALTTALEEFAEGLSDTNQGARLALIAEGRAALALVEGKVTP